MWFLFTQISYILASILCFNYGSRNKENDEQKARQEEDRETSR